MADSHPHQPAPILTALTCVSAIAFTFLWKEGNAIDAMRMNEQGIGREPWRLVSSVLAHGDMLHLFFNCYWLWRLGRELEARLSPPQLLGLFALTGLGSSAAQYAVGVGAIGLSGVVYGLVGFLWLAGRLRDDLAGVLGTSTARFFVGWFFICLLLSYFGIYPVANVAHGVGAFLGIAAGWAYASPYPRSWIRWGVTGTCFLLLLVSPRLVPITWLSTPDLFLRIAGRIEQGADTLPPDELVDLARVALDRDDSETATWPGSDYFWYVSSYYKYELGLSEQAVAEARRALELNPDLEGPSAILIPAQYNLAIEALRAGDEERALELLRAVLSLDDANLRTWELLVELHLEMGNEELASKARRRAAALR
jgi:membrane associated rhomboid family serine protease